MSTPPDLLSPAERSLHDALTNNLRFFARHALKVKSKSGALIPFEFNAAQVYLHNQLEEQKRKTGRVRALICKGRQQGCSTYTAARFYHRATRVQGQSVFILSHEGETTKKLFQIVERFQENCPEAVRPEAEIANRKEYKFKSLQSDYSVGTAGNEDVGRGGTMQLFHGSEVAYWEHTDQIQTGIFQCIPDIDGTEMILESTANGMGNLFYDLCMDALEGKNNYILVFIPWFWQDEYEQTPPPDFVLTKEEEEYMTTYNLTLPKMVWRRMKIAEFKSDWKFKQEYPANVMEAFQTSGDRFINSEFVMAARKSRIKDPNASLVIGVDPGRTGDRTVFAYRRGREFSHYEAFVYAPEDNAEMVTAGRLANRIDMYAPSKVFIDIGYGYGIVDRLKEMGYGDIVTGVHFGQGALDPTIYANKRAEMWCLMRNWIHREDGEVSIPDDDKVHKDLLLMPKEKETSSQLIQLVSKKEIRTKFRMSPDLADALALTFAYPVRRQEQTLIERRHNMTKPKSPLKTLNRVRGEVKTKNASFWVTK